MLRQEAVTEKEEHVTAPHPDHDDVPEADLLEQQAPVDPPAAPDAEAVSDSSDTLPSEPADEADEADRLEQHEVVPGDDDDYPRDA
ncbi:hypothetical protein [Terrabacter sp. NPDC080008]|uniref:hypothetical protein n=1 Tax=Terrabacter sp. NPDC080008 TaxID=3155176 RepID=UPI003450330B